MEELTPGPVLSEAAEASLRPLSGLFESYPRKEGSKRGATFRVLEAPGNHSDLSPTKLSYHLTCFPGTTCLPHTNLGGWARWVMPIQFS